MQLLRVRHIQEPLGRGRAQVLIGVGPDDVEHPLNREHLLIACFAEGPPSDKAVVATHQRFDQIIDRRTPEESVAYRRQGRRCMLTSSTGEQHSEDSAGIARAESGQECVVSLCAHLGYVVEEA
ncbi:hypothetical protein GCM10009593_27230 [Microlunatus antarcticus]